MSVRLSFVAQQAYPLLDSQATGGIGGAEVRAVNFARGLQKLASFEIEFIVAPRDDLLTESAGIRIRAYEKQRGAARAAAKLRHSFASRFTNLPPRDPFYGRLDTDVVLCFGVRNDTASIIRTTKERGQRSVVFLTSDRNIEDARRHGRHDRGAYGELGCLCRYALCHADRVVCQTAFQQSELLRSIRVTSQLIRNPVSLDETETEQSERCFALWVGRADTFSKRADLCVELARRCPTVEFVMIMNNHDDETFESLQRTSPPNVRIVERVPYTEVESYFRRASVLVNTSSAEGFPNSFLQAGKFGKPVVSLSVDPANMLSEAGCGVCCRDDLQYMAAEVTRLVSSPGGYDRLSKNIRRYVRQNHLAESCSLRLKELLDELTSRRSVA